MSAEPFDARTIPLAGTQLVEASAGTGKTWAIGVLVLRLLIERRYDISRILVVTFTEAAAAQLRDRVRRRLVGALRSYETGRVDDPVLGDLRARWREQGLADGTIVGRLRAAVHGFDEAPISTIHGFCHRVLRESAFETGVAFDTELRIDDLPMIEELVHDLWARELYAADGAFVRHLMDKNVTPEKLVELARTAQRFPRAVLLGGEEAAEIPGVEHLDALWHRMRTHWSTRRDAILRTLDLARLRGTYKPADVPARVLSLDTWFSRSERGTDLTITHFGWFRSSKLVLHLRSGATPITDEFFDLCEEYMAAAELLTHTLEPRRERLQRRVVEALRRELPKRKAAAGVQSFDDLLRRVAEALEGRKGGKLAEALRERYPAALIDEFQDTDPVQDGIFARIYAARDAPLLLIGDPKQAIYSFRGADVYAYLHAGRRAQRHWTMGVNWRSDPALVAAVARVFDRPNPFAIEDIGFPAVQPRPGASAGLHIDGQAAPAFEIRVVERSDGAPLYQDAGIALISRQVATDIASLLHRDARVGTAPDARPLHAGDIAVLVRSHRQAREIQNALRACEVPSVLHGDAIVFDTDEATELAHVLAAMAEPSDARLVRAALATELLAVDAQTIARLAAGDDVPELEPRVDSLHRLHARWIERGFVAALRGLFADEALVQRTLSRADGERRMTNFLHLGELLHDAATREHLGPAGLLRWFAERRRVPKVEADAYKIRLERDDRAVAVVTIHFSKGLEYPIVYLPFLATATRNQVNVPYSFHDAEDEHAPRLAVVDAASAKAQCHREEEAERRRVLYVALTRARHRVVCWLGKFHGAHPAILDLLCGTTTYPADDATLVERLRERGGGLWHVTLAEPPRTVRAPAPAVPSLRPRARTITTPIASWPRMSSFTHLAASAPPHLPIALEGRDHDELAPAILHDAPIPVRRASPLLGFPGGRNTGNFFHDVLEHVDFAAEDAALEQAVRQRLPAFGLPVEPWTEPAVAALRSLLSAPLKDGETGGHAPIRLCDVLPAQRRSELPFMLPVGRTGAGMVATRLAEAFAVAPEGLPAGYAAQVRDLRFRELVGHLKGFVDLVFMHEGRWWVVDYKTNDLGDDLDDYTRERLAVAMAHSHYVLQYHLYTVALVRHLRWRQPGFDYDRHFGGVLYLFLRGITPESGPTRGVWLERPPRARIEAMDLALQGLAPEGRA